MKKISRSWLIGLLFLLGSAGARAEEAPKFTLAQAVAVLEKTHPVLSAADQGVRATAQDAVAAGLWSNPTLSASYTNAWNTTYDPAGIMSAGLTQFLDVAGAPAARRRALEMTSKSLAMDRQALRNELVFQLETAAVELAFCREVVQVAGDYRKLVLEVVRIVDTRVQGGAAPDYDRESVAVFSANAEADQASVWADLASSEAAFFAAVGPGGSALAGQLALDLGEAPTLPAAHELLDYLRQKRPDVLSARARTDASEASVEAARRSVFPGFALTVGTAFGNGPGQVDLSGAVSMPLPLVDRGQGKVSAARQRVEQSRAVEQGLLLPAERLVIGVHTEVERRRDAERSYVARVHMASEAMLREALAGYQGGKLDILELAAAHVAWREARVRALELSARARLSEIELGRATGVSLREWAGRGGRT